MTDMPDDFYISITSKNTFIQNAITYALKDILKGISDINLTINDSNYKDKDVIFYEVSPGELYICNEKLLDRKRGGLLYVIHNTEQICNNNEISVCFRDSIFIDIKKQSMNKIITTLRSELFSCKSRLYKPTLQNIIYRNKSLKITETQLKIVSYLLNGMDLTQISKKNKVSLRTTRYHIKEIMRRFHLKNVCELYKFIYLLKKRGFITQMNVDD